MSEDQATTAGPRQGIWRGLEWIDRTVEWSIIIIVVGMVATVSTQVFLRYAFNASIDWADDVGRLLFVWTIFLGVPIAIKHGSHIGIEMVVKKLPESAQHALVRLMAVLAAGMMAIIGWQAVKVAIDQWDEMLPTVDVTVATFIVPVIIGCFHSVLHLARQAIVGIAPHPEKPEEMIE